MTAGDPISVLQLIPSNGYLEIKPPVGEVWMIKNIYFGNEWELKKVASPEISIVIGSGVNNGMWKNMTLITDNEIFLAIQNISASSSIYGFDGLVIK